MNELETKALWHIIQLSKKADGLTTDASLKLHTGKVPLDAEKDIYPIGSVAREIEYWAKAIIDNNKK